MPMLEGLPLWGYAVVFCVGAVVVWIAGTRLSSGAEAVAERTGLGQAFIGALLLGGATSLPEIAATTSAAFLGSAPIAVNNIFGGIAMQVAVLAIADAVYGRRALSAGARDASVLIEGVLLVFVLAAAATAISVGDRALFGAGAWSMAVLALVVVSLYLVKKYEMQPEWHAREEAAPPGEQRAERRRAQRERMRSLSNTRLTLQLVLAAAGVLAAGFSVAKAGEQIAEQTGIGGSFVGAALMPLATSLPELSTTLAAVRIGAPLMAISNIFGTNLFDAALLPVVDVVYPGGPVLNEVGQFAQVGALLGIACTCIYLAGILERRDKTVMRLGLDSILVVLTYAGGMVLLYTLR